MPNRTRELTETLKRNTRLRHYQPDTAFEPLGQAPTIVDAFLAELATINADRHLTPEGKAAARQKAATTATETIKAWHTPRVAGLDADLGAQRAALLPTGERPDARRVDYMLGILQRHTPDEVAIFYNSATDDERRVMEAASASVGRVPTKTAAGLVWQPLLNPASVRGSILARAEAQNPAAVERLRELEDIRASHVTVAAHAIKEVRDAVAG